MSPIRTRKSLARKSVVGTKNVTLLAALVAAALTATPLVLSASGARATSETPAAEPALRIAPVEVTPIAAPKAEPCLRKVRVVYGGYGTPEGCAAR